VLQNPEMIGLKYFLISQKYSKCQITQAKPSFEKKFEFFQNKAFVVPS
jgi:hypothetical protein